MTVGKICQREVDLVLPTESCQVAAERMRQRQVGTLVILTSAKRPIGILTDRDLAVRLVAKGLDPVATTVGQVMSAEPRCISEATRIEDAVLRMRLDSIRRLVVVNDADEIVGIVSLDDILVLISEEMAHIGKLLDKETPRSLARV
jgi:CBS domain-containing protein